MSNAGCRFLQSRFCGLGFVILGLCLITGCGGGSQVGTQFPVEGTIRWPDNSDANQLGGGEIEFESAGAVAAKAKIESDATYMLPSALSPGKYRIRIAPPAASKAGADPRYEDFAKSGWSVDVGSERQRVDLKITRR